MDALGLPLQSGAIRYGSPQHQKMVKSSLASAWTRTPGNSSMTNYSLQSRSPSMPTSSTVTPPLLSLESGRAYLHWGSPGTACIDTKNFKTLWTRPDFICYLCGSGSSPFIYNDLLVLTMDGADVQYLVALDKDTGKTIWRTDRSTDFKDLDTNGNPKRDGDERKCYSTPIIVNVDGRDLLISPGAKAAWAYEPLTGKPVWQFRYKNHSSASRPVFNNGLLYINSGYSVAELFAVKPSGTGDITDKNKVWGVSGPTFQRSPHILHEGLLYLCSDSGIATCLDAATGKEIWKARLGGNYSAALIRHNNHIYAFSEDGRGVVFTTGRVQAHLGKQTSRRIHGVTSSFRKLALSPYAHPLVSGWCWIDPSRQTTRRCRLNRA